MSEKGATPEVQNRGCFVIFLIAFLCSRAAAQTGPAGILPQGSLPYLKDSRLIQISSHDRTGGNADYIAIKDGATAVLADIQGPGVIVQMWVTISSPDPHFLRRILLRMYWDKESSPSVEVPIGDFFGTGFQYRQYTTPYLGMSSGGYYCYFPMPFNTAARIEVVNQTGRAVNAFYYHIDYQKLPGKMDSTVGYFHAQWRRELRTARKQNYTILEASGRGQLVGVNLSMQSYDGSLSFLEGDEMFYVDGEREPSVYGTGTEDYFNSGWYFNHGEYAAPYHGLIFKDDSLGRIAAYRFHIQDAIPFTHSLRATIEHGTQNTEAADYSSTAYWYQREPHAQFPPMPPASLRIPLRVAVPNGAVEGESLRPEGTRVRSVVEDMSEYGPDWSGLKQLKVRCATAGDSFRLAVPAGDGRFDVAVYYTRGPGYGDVAVSDGSQRVGSWRGFSKETLPGGDIVLKDLEADHGVITLHFTAEGKDAASAGYAVGIDAFVLKPHRDFIGSWYTIGPFPNPEDQNGTRLGLDSVFAPEREVNLNLAYRGAGGQAVKWTLVKTPASGYVDLTGYSPSEHVVAYALTFIHANAPVNVPLLLGSDDGVKVFFNGKEVHRLLTVRVAVPDQDTVVLPLKEGWNELRLKIENNLGGYGFYARVLDPEKKLVINAEQN